MKAFFASATAPDWISVSIALLALGLSAFSLYLQWRDKRPYLKLRAKLGQRFRQLSYDPATDQPHGENQPAIVVGIQNVGDRPITLLYGVVRPLIGHGRQVELVRDCGPREIARDSSREWHAFIRDVLDGIGAASHWVGLYRLEVRDDMGRRWCSQYFRIRPDGGAT